MIGKHKVYKTKKTQKKGRFFSFIFKLALLTFLIFTFVSHFLIASYRMDSVSMEPSIGRGESLFVSPLGYGPYLPGLDLRISGFQTPARGDVVLLQPPYKKSLEFPGSFLNLFVRFFTLNMNNLSGGSEEIKTKYLIKRVIGIPGDTIKIEGFKAYIKPGGQEIFSPEGELISIDYTPKIDSSYFTPGWQSSFPFSGEMAEVTLKENEYFVLGDNRVYSSDSRLLGTIKMENILGKVILRYFPLNKIGIL